MLNKATRALYELGLQTLKTNFFLKIKCMFPYGGVHSIQRLTVNGKLAIFAFVDKVELKELQDNRKEPFWSVLGAQSLWTTGHKEWYLFANRQLSFDYSETQDTRVLISLVQNKPELYNMRHQDYFNNSRRNSMIYLFFAYTCTSHIIKRCFTSF